MSRERAQEDRFGGGAVSPRPRGRPRRIPPAHDWPARTTAVAALAALSAATLAAAAPLTNKQSPYMPSRQTGHAMEYYAAYGGVDELHVQLTASGNLIRFSYRVLDPAAAKALVDNKATPYLFAPRTRALLQVPVMDQIGPLRQTGEAEVGKAYWMVFSNKGKFVKPGDRVNVIVGTYHIDGLMVE
jgi:hypothetical protein